MDDCRNFLLLAEIVLIWPMSTAVVERGFSSMNRVKKQLRSSMHPENLDGVLRISVKYHPIPKAQRPQAFVNSGLLSQNCQQVPRLKLQTSKRAVDRGTIPRPNYGLDLLRRTLLKACNCYNIYDIFS